VVLGIVVFGVVVVGGDDDGGGAGAAGVAACRAGAGSGAGGGGSLPVADAGAAVVVGVLMAGPAAGAGAAGGAVVAVGFAFGGAGRSVSRIMAVTEPKPMTNAATHASGIRTARRRSLARKERRPCSASPCSRAVPSTSWNPAGSVGASPSSVAPTGPVASSMSGTPLTCRTITTMQCSFPWSILRNRGCRAFVPATADFGLRPNPYWGEMRRAARFPPIRTRPGERGIGSQSGRGGLAFRIRYPPFAARLKLRPLE
jgi:hypothetical protein